MQAQAPDPPYVGLWTRLVDFDPFELAGLITDRRAVRIALMRGTVHLVTAQDCLALRPVVQPVLSRSLRYTPFGKDLTGADVDAVVLAGRALVEEHPRTGAELGSLLARQWPERDPAALSQAVRHLTPLVQVPPRGVWGAGGRAVLTTAEAWLDRPLHSETEPDQLARRYLGAFGPATVQDIQVWSGLAGLREVAERLRPALRTYRDEHGRELFDLPDIALPDPETPAPVRFVPEFDNLTLSHADRARVIADEHRKRMSSRNGMVPGSVLVDGFVAATYRIDRQRRSSTLVVHPFAPLTKAATAAVTGEGALLLRFVAADADFHDVRIAPAG
jgi:hypothetical protein